MSSATHATVWPSPRIASAKPGTFAAKPAEEIVSRMLRRRTLPPVRRFGGPSQPRRRATLATLYLDDLAMSARLHFRRGHGIGMGVIDAPPPSVT